MKCKVGDLAFIKKALREENIGRVVTCTKYLGYYSRGDTITISGELWLAPDSDDFWCVTGNLSTQFGQASQAYIADSWLYPLEELPPEEFDEVGELLENDLALVD